MKLPSLLLKALILFYGIFDKAKQVSALIESFYQERKGLIGSVGVVLKMLLVDSNTIIPPKLKSSYDFLLRNAKPIMKFLKESKELEEAKELLEGCQGRNESDEDTLKCIIKGFTNYLSTDKGKMKLNTILRQLTAASVSILNGKLKAPFQGLRTSQLEKIGQRAYDEHYSLEKETLQGMGELYMKKYNNYYNR